MTVAITDVRNIAPEMRDTAAIPDPEVTAAIADALLEVNANTWGTMVDLGTKWLAAHKLALSHPELSMLPGQRIRAYETSGAEAAGQLGTTRFGIEFVRLRRTLGLGCQVL